MRKSIKVVSLVVGTTMLATIVAGCGGTSTTSSNSTSKSNEEESKTDEKDFKPVVWKFAHSRNEESRAHKAVVEFAKTVEEKTNGDIKIEIYPNGTLGDYETVQERVSMGDVTFQMSDPGQNIDRSLILPTIPYLMSSWDEVKEHTTMGTGMLANFISDRLALQNIHVINNYPQYFASVASSKEIPNPTDPQVTRNLKMRVPTSKPFELLGNTFGFQSTPMPANEVFTSIQTGIIDGMIGGGTEYYYNQLGELIKYVLPIKTHFVAYWMVINNDAWESLPSEYQQIITDAAQVLHDSGMEKAMEEETMYEEMFEEQGAKVYKLTDEEVTAYANVYREKVWGQLDDIVGEEGVKILNQFRDKYGIDY